MNVYEGLTQLGKRLGKEFPPWSEGATDAPYLLIVHAAPDQHGWCEDTGLPTWKSDAGCKGVLFLSGVTYGGFSPEERAEITKQYGADWVHFLSQAVGRSGQAPPSFSVFLERVKNNVIDWNIVDPEWPPNLVALFLLSRVVSVLQRENQSSKLTMLRDSSPDEFGELRRLASAEYESVGRQAFGDSPFGDSAGALAIKLEAFFKEWCKERGIVPR